MGPRQCLGRHLALAEMRLILARLVWAYDVETTGKSLKWAELRTFLLVEKKPLEVRLRAREIRWNELQKSHGLLIPNATQN